MSQNAVALDRRGMIERYQDDLDRRMVRLGYRKPARQFIAESQPQVPGSTPPATSARTDSQRRICLRETLDLSGRQRRPKSFGTCHGCQHFERLSTRLPLRPDGRPAIRAGSEEDLRAVCTEGTAMEDESEAGFAEGRKFLPDVDTKVRRWMLDR